MRSQSPHPRTTPVVRIVQKQHKRRPSGNSQLPAAKRRVSAPAGERDCSQGESSVASTIPGQNSTPSSLLNNSGVADITQRVTVTPSATQRRSMITPTAMPGTSSRSIPAPGGTSQTDSTRHVVSSLASGIASTPTPLRGLENLPTSIPNPEACVTITNPLRTRAKERNQRQRQWQMQPQAVSTPQSVVSGSCSIHRFGHSDMMCLVFATGRLMELYMWNTRPFKSASDLEMVSYAMNATRCESISWSPTLPDNREVLEHRYAAKQHLVHRIWGMHKGDFERGMLQRRPTLDITHSIGYQVRAQVDKVKSHLIQSARDRIAELYDLHRFESNAERLQFIDSLLADNKYLFPVAERVESGVRGPNPTQKVLKAGNKWPASTLLPGGSNPGVYQHQILSSGE